MKIADLKYIWGFAGVPAIVIVSLLFNGYWTFFAPVIAFVGIPVLEQILPQRKINPDEATEKTQLSKRFFDILLYLNVPIQYGLLGYFLYVVSYTDLTIFELVGKTISMGVGCGILGINAAHELGHRVTKYEQGMAKALLLTSLYMHFFIEHNRGHHKNVSTPVDPASARLNEPIYTFWFRSIFGSYFSAIHLEKLRLQRAGSKTFSIKNEMIQFALIQSLFILLIGFIFGPAAILFFMGAAGFGILLLETVNYIEHYGLRRREIEPGLYEKVKPTHSWNSEHILGRIMLYELTRHSDHHYKANRKYQVLRYFEESPQLPLGYPASMVLALVPPLWFSLMNPKIKKIDPLPIMA
jgi:alkane 1-monooxygenase